MTYNDDIIIILTPYLPFSVYYFFNQDEINVSRDHLVGVYFILINVRVAWCVVPAVSAAALREIAVHRTLNLSDFRPRNYFNHTNNDIKFKLLLKNRFFFFFFSCCVRNQKKVIWLCITSS